MSHECVIHSVYLYLLPMEVNIQGGCEGEEAGLKVNGPSCTHIGGLSVLPPSPTRLAAGASHNGYDLLNSS